MKNLVTLFIVLSVCATVKGQIRMRVNGNNDGNDSARVILKVSEGLSGYQMLLDADANTYNTVGAPVFILSYRHFEYKIPVNADRNPSTNNKIVNGSGGVNIPAGVYDYFITKPSPNSNPLLNRIECESGSYSATRGHNFVFEAGKTYLFTVFPDGFVICDIRPADVPSEPSGLTVTSSTSGASKCTLNWKNPDSTAGENPLPDLTSVTILRDSKVVDLISGTSPGVNVAWTDENPVKKEHTYSVYAKNNAGAGFSISKMVAMDTVIFHPAVNKDAAIIAITNPVNGMNLSDTETVTVIVKNKGLQAISNIPLSFDIDGQPVGSGICTASIPAGGEVAFPFSQKANLSDARSSYIIKARTVLNGDENPDNDVFITQIDNYGDCHIDAPCFLGFEDDMEFNCWSSYNDSENSYWKRINKLTSAEPVRSGQSAMIFPWTKGTGWLVSPRIKIPATGKSLLSFWSQFYIHSSTGKNSVLITENSSPDPDVANYTEIWSSQSFSQNVWIEELVNLDNYRGKEVYIAFRREGTDKEYAHRWALDDISIFMFPDKDVGVESINTPESGAHLRNDESITVTVKNFGSQTVNNIPVYYQINGGSTIQETIASLESQKDTAYTFNARADLSMPGDYTVKVYTGLTDDENSDNDAKTIQVSNYGDCIVDIFPYKFGFENRDSLNCWKAIFPGPVNVPDIEGAEIAAPHEGEHFWRFVSFYGNSANSKYYEQYLVTPELATGRPKIFEFYYRPSEIWLYAKFKVGYSTTDNKPDSFTWISDTETNKTVWTKYSNIIPADAKYVAVFNYTNNLFLYIDDIYIDILPETKDAGVTRIISPLHGNPEDASVTVTIKNFGGTPISSFNVAYQLLDNPPVIETCTVAIDPAISIDYTFSQKVDISEYRDDYRLKIYTLLNGDTDRSNDTASVQFIYRPNVKLYGYRIDDAVEHSSLDYMSPVIFNSDDPSQVSMINDYRDDSNIFTACEFLNDTLYAYTTDYGRFGFYIKLTGDWQQISKVDAANYALDMAYDCTTNTMFATTGTNLRKVNLETGVMTQIAATRLFWTLACDLKGQLYGIDENGWFCKIDKKTGAATQIKKQNPIPARNHQSMAFDHNTERLFWAMAASGFREDGRPIDLGRLYEINPETGDAVNLGSINGAGEAEIVGLYTPYKYNNVKINITDAPKQISFYPNPSDGKIHIDYAPQNAVISILDLSGRLLKTYTGLDENANLDLNLSKGVYIIKIEGNNDKLVTKLIIR